MFQSYEEEDDWDVGRAVKAAFKAKGHTIYYSDFPPALMVDDQPFDISALVPERQQAAGQQGAGITE